jgi:hypothetical protein
MLQADFPSVAALRESKVWVGSAMIKKAVRQVDQARRGLFECRLGDVRLRASFALSVFHHRAFRVLTKRTLESAFVVVRRRRGGTRRKAMLS